MHVQMILASAERPVESDQSLILLILRFFSVNNYDIFTLIFQQKLISHVLHMPQQLDVHLRKWIYTLDMIFRTNHQMFISLFRDVLKNRYFVIFVN